jgi:hypothetical protein
VIRYPQAFFEVSLTNFNLLLKLTKDAGEKFKLNFGHKLLNTQSKHAPKTTVSI